MNEESIGKEKDEMNEEIREEKEEIGVSEGAEPSEAVEKLTTVEEPSAAEEPPTEEEPEDAERPIMPLKRVNRFFLAALFPLLFIVIFGVILLFMKPAEERTDTEEPTEDDYYEVKSDEVRGIYVATAYNINYPSAQSLGASALKAELDEIILTCAENGFNAVYFQVSPFSDALYSSSILPTSYVLTGAEGGELPEGFDPLAYLCDKAHKAGIAVHAWINPMRVTGGSLDAEELSTDNPAVLSPEYTVTYGGEVYYDLGNPEARVLQARVCEEIVRNYTIDGIIFDDYFYPYPVEGEEFDDSASFALYGGEYESVADFRRAATTALISECYDAVKATRPDCLFGVAPFGIWQNDDGSNGGSDTRGMESYESLYCDSLAFIKAGKIDYIAPQIYWRFESSAAPYGELCDWWAEAVKGTDVKLLISHAAYQAAEWNDSDEYTEQVEYARTKRAYYGSIFYGYAAVAGNDAGIADAFAHIYGEE